MANLRLFFFFFAFFFQWGQIRSCEKTARRSRSGPAYIASTGGGLADIASTGGGTRGDRAQRDTLTSSRRRARGVGVGVAMIALRSSVHRVDGGGAPACPTSRGKVHRKCPDFGHVCFKALTGPAQCTRNALFQCDDN